MPLAVLAPSWLGLLYGEAFTASAVPFVVLLLGCVPFTVSVILASALAGVDRQEVNLKCFTRRTGRDGRAGRGC